MQHRFAIIMLEQHTFIILTHIWWTTHSLQVICIFKKCTAIHRKQLNTGSQSQTVCTIPLLSSASRIFMLLLTRRSLWLTISSWDCWTPSFTYLSFSTLRLVVGMSV